jgi:lipopolysaccharide transport system ATP-binding protein
VGDAHFGAKCVRRITDFRRKGGSLILVSHDLGSVKVLTDRALLLHRGRVIERGEPEAVCRAYNCLIAQMDDDAARQAQKLAEIRRNERSSFGSMTARIIDARLVGASSGGAAVQSGEPAEVVLDIACSQAIPQATIGVMFRDRYGQDIFGTNSYHMRQRVDLAAGRRYTVRFPIAAMNLGLGRYTITVAIHNDATHVEACHHWFDNISEFEVNGYRGDFFVGVTRLEAGFTIQETGAA